MLRRGRALRAVPWVLLLAAGCWPDSAFLNPGWTTGGRCQVVPGSPEGVSLAAQAALGRMGLFVRAGRDGQAVRLRSATASGRRFTLVLEAQQSVAGKETRLRVEWEGEAEEEFWPAFLGVLTPALGEGAGGPGAAGARP